MQPIIVINAVGLTPRLLPLAPRLSALAQTGWMTPLDGVIPAVTCSAQATLLTGQPVDRHGIVTNGWHFRDTTEVRFWQQSNRLIQAEPLYATAKKRAAERGRSFKSAKLFWWFNQGAAVDISVTPKPWYGVDGNKVFGITGTPLGHAERLEAKLGRFPFDQKEALRRLAEWSAATQARRLQLQRQWTSEFREEYRRLKEEARWHGRPARVLSSSK